MSRLSLSIALFAIGMAWATTIPLTKIAVSTGHQPLGLIVWQLVIVSMVLLPVVLRRPLPNLLSGRAQFNFIAIALMGTIFPNLLSYTAAVHLPAGIMAIAIATVPMFAMLIALVWRLERYSHLRTLGVMLGLAAIVLLIGPEASLPVPGQIFFLLLVLAASVSYAAENNYVAACVPRGFDPVAVILGASVVGLVIVTPAAIYLGNMINPLEPWSKAEWAIVAASVFHAIAYCGFVWLIGRAGPTFAGQVAYIVTIGGVLLSATFLDESFASTVWIALALMLAGVAFVQPRDVSENLK